MFQRDVFFELTANKHFENVLHFRSAYSRMSYPWFLPGRYFSFSHAARIFLQAPTTFGLLYKMFIAPVL